MPPLKSFMLALLLLSSIRGQPADNGALGRSIRSTRWISYAPTGYFPGEDPPTLPSNASIRADLAVIREAGFDGIITYGMDISHLPDLISQEGFRSMLLGVWNPLSQSELKRAISAVKRNSKLVLGVIIGNEGLLRGDYTVERLCDALGMVRMATGKPVSSTEPVDVFFGEKRLAECSSFLTVNAHPYFTGRKSVPDALQWTTQAWDAIRSIYSGKPTIFKETGLPSRGDTVLNEAVQKEYFVGLAKTNVVFAYFEAFDATARFKEGEIEQSWGLWRFDRSPKPVVKALPWRQQ